MSLRARHLSLQAEAIAREEMCRAKQPAPRTKLPLKTGDAPKTGVAGESRSSSGPCRLRIPVKLTACAGSG